jgi:hypothetical protein
MERGVAMPARFVVKKGTTGKFRFVLLAANGEPIATSELYSTKASCLAGIRAVRRAAWAAPVDDLTKPPPKAAAKSAATARKKAPAKKTTAKAKSGGRPRARRAKATPAPASQTGGSKLG